MAEWITTKEAANLLKTSVRNVITKIHQGKLRARRDGKIWLIHSSLSPSSEETSGIRTESERNAAEIDHLRKQIERKDQQIEGLQKQLEAEAEARQRSDTIILQLTRQLEQSQRLLEYHQEPWYRRWFRRKSD
jgi:excisionase family DNA binding protein